MRYLKVAVLVLVLAVVLVGSLVAVSEQTRQPAPAAVAGSASGARDRPSSAGCGGPGATGPCAAEQLLKAKEVLKDAAPKTCAQAPKCVNCDPKTCEECAAGRGDAKADRPAGSGTAGTAAKAERAASRTAGKAKAGRPAAASADGKAAKSEKADAVPASPAKPVAAKVHHHQGEDCAGCHDGDAGAGPTKPAAGAAGAPPPEPADH